MLNIQIIPTPGNGNGGIVPPWLQGPNTPHIMEMPAPPKPKEPSK